MAHTIFQVVSMRNDQNLWMALGEVACKGRTFPRMICKEPRL